MNRRCHPERSAEREVEGQLLCIATLAIAALLAGCANLSGGGVVPAPSPSATPTIAPGACNTVPSINPNVVLIGIGSEVTTVTDPTYGAIAGYFEARGSQRHLLIHDINFYHEWSAVQNSASRRCT